MPFETTMQQNPSHIELHHPPMRPSLEDTAKSLPCFDPLLYAPPLRDPRRPLLMRHSPMRTSGRPILPRQKGTRGTGENNLPHPLSIKASNILYQKTCITNLRQKSNHPNICTFRGIFCFHIKCMRKWLPIPPLSDCVLSTHRHRKLSRWSLPTPKNLVSHSHVANVLRTFACS